MNPNLDIWVLNNQVRIRMNGMFVRVETFFGLAFDYNPVNFEFSAYLPVSLQQSTDGLCSSFDGNSANDMIDSQGIDRSSDVIAFGNSWQVPDPEDPKLVNIHEYTL